MPSSVELSIIIVSYNVKDLLLKCIESVISACHGLSYEIFVVDNASRDGSAKAIRENFPYVFLIESKENVGFARGNNLAYEKCSGEFILLLNPDTIISSSAITETLALFRQKPDAGIAGCRIIGSDGTLQKSVQSYFTIRRNIAAALFIDRFIYSANKTAFYYAKESFPVDSVLGAYMMVSRKALDGKFLLNPDYFMYSEEKDLSLRLMHKGWKTYFVPTAEIIHYGGMSTSLMAGKMFLELQKSQIIFYRFFFPSFYSFALCISWWMVLVSQLIISLFLLFRKNGVSRLLLFINSVFRYPYFVYSAYFRKSSPHKQITL